MLLDITVIVVTLATVVTRVRRARGIERLQLQWMALAFAVVALSLVLGALAGSLFPEMSDGVARIMDNIFFSAATLGTAASMGIAILRHNLYDIERIINRAVVYVTLSACLALGYAGLVVLLQALLEPLTHGSDLTVAGATLGLAAAARPLHRRIQGTVDRRFYRRRYDAEQTIAAFSARLREQLELDALVADLQGVVQQAMQPSHVSIWVRPLAGRSALNRSRS